MVTDLLNGKENVLLVVNSNDLKEIVNRFVDEREAEREEKRKQEQEDTLLSADEVAGRLGVTKNTLWRWSKEKLLKPVGRGKKKFYRLSDVEKFFNNGGE